MGKVVQFPIRLSEKDKKIIRLESYIKSNLIDLARLRQELIALRKQVAILERKNRLKVVNNEQSDGKQ